MEPRIQYAKTSDGVTIAFWAMGEGGGVPLVWLPGLPFSHTQLSWRLSVWRAHYEAVLEKRRLVYIDFRGAGLSQRDVDDVSLNTCALDVEAVIDRLDLPICALQGFGLAGQVAAAYASRHPERVSHLILLSSYTRASDMAKVPEMRTLGSLLRRGAWEMYLDAMSHLMYGWDTEGDARELATLLREFSSQRTVLALAIPTFDVTSLLPELSLPTLVVHYRQSIFPDEEAARSLTSSIRDARLVTLDGKAATLENLQEYIRALDEFLAEGLAEKEALPSGTAIILFADIADSTALTERLGDAAFREKARELDGALRTVIREHVGTAIEGKLLGDGVLAVFTSARQAIEAALACARSGGDGGLPLHLGLHAGDVIREDNNVYGGAVNIASRIAGLSAPGECWSRIRCARWRGRRRECGSRAGGSRR
jgi:pimeloyl-ACP methyl ester carboxylesterase